MDLEHALRLRIARYAWRCHVAHPEWTPHDIALRLFERHKVGRRGGPLRGAMIRRFIDVYGACERHGVEPCPADFAAWWERETQPLAAPLRVIEGGRK